ncbi:MAG: biopolymer transporter ExbD [Candidatus Krumholzibacteria bacterium]|nr:biopolymer transporter ExbD [Candidatus Krumholzibacteria bacterium]
MKRLIQPAPTIAGINVTPIIDVALVLVIILLITAPMISASNMEINLPEAQARSIEDEVRISVTIGKGGELAVDEDQVTPDALIAAIAARIEASKDKDILVVVRADETASYEIVRKILKDTRKAGAKRIAIATRQRGRLN